MAGWTNKGKAAALDATYRGLGVPTAYYMALLTTATAPDADTNLMSDVTQVTAGNGYTAGGISVATDATDFDVLTEDDGNDRGLIQILDLVWTASGGDLPSGNGARYAVLTDDNATTASREILNYFDLTSTRVVSNTQTLTLQDCEIRINES